MLCAGIVFLLENIRFLWDFDSFDGKGRRVIFTQNVIVIWNMLHCYTLHLIKKKWMRPNVYNFWPLSKDLYLKRKQFLEQDITIDVLDMMCQKKHSSALV